MNDGEYKVNLPDGCEIERGQDEDELDPWTDAITEWEDKECE